MKFSTANLQNRHLAYPEARFLPRNLFHFYKKSHPVRDTPFSADFHVSLPHFPSFPSNSIRDTLFSPKFPVSLQHSTSYDRISSATHPFLPISLCRASLPPVPTFPLPPNPLTLSSFLNLRAPYSRHALSVIA